MSVPVREVRGSDSKNEASNDGGSLVKLPSRFSSAREKNVEAVQDNIPIGNVSDFDYAAVPVSVARFLKGQATRIRQYTGKAIIQIGKDLAAAKRYLSHGQFVRWVETEVGIPARTAQGYMRAAQWASGKGPAVAALPASLLYVLSAPNTPKEFVEDIVNRAEAGERVVLSTVRSSLKSLRDTTKRARINGSSESTKMIRNYDLSQYQGMSNGETPLIEAVRILASALSRSDLSRIRKIMISDEVLQHPDLSKNIKVAFSTIPEQNGYGNGIGQECVADETSVPASENPPGKESARKFKSGSARAMAI
jgi:hypothetical protein